MFDPRIVHKVIELWSKVDEGSKSSLQFAHVEAVLETVFLAGLKRDEERAVQVSVSLGAPITNPDPGRGGESLAFTFSNRPLLTVETLLKLAFAFDAATTSLAATPQPDDLEKLELWGAVFTSHRGRNRFDAVNLCPPALDVLRVTSKKPGVLQIYRGDLLLARFNSGDFLEPVSGHFTSGLMGWSFLDGIKEHPEFRLFGSKYWDIYRAFIDYLLAETEIRGHGGIIIWHPPRDIEMFRKNLIRKNGLIESPEGVLFLNDLCEMEQKREKNQITANSGEVAADARVIEETISECKRRVVEHAEALAQMTCVDGALVISDRLRPLSFGSVLEAPPWQGEVVYLLNNEPQPFSRRERVSQYGTRHHAALNYIGQFPGTVAFVISQDGPITGLIKKDEKTIFWWPDCLSKH
jgi:hypothetical protein